MSNTNNKIFKFYQFKDNPMDYSYDDSSDKPDISYKLCKTLDSVSHDKKFLSPDLIKIDCDHALNIIKCSLNVMSTCKYLTVSLNH